MLVEVDIKHRVCSKIKINKEMRAHNREETKIDGIKKYFSSSVD